MIITGGEGWIGSHLDFYDMHMIDLIEGNDIVDMTIDDFQFTGTVIHLAAVSSIPRSFKDPEETMRTNIYGLAHVVQLCKEANAKLIFISSSSVVDPQSPYAYSKLWGEHLVKDSGLDYCILRLGNVYGEGDDKSAIMHFLQDEEITIYGTGQQIRNFVYVKDVARAIEESIHWRGTHNIGHENMTIQEVAELFDKPISYAEPREGDALDLSMEIESVLWHPTMRLEDWVVT